MPPAATSSEAFRQLAEGLIESGTPRVFDRLVARIATILDVDHVLIAEADPTTHMARTLACWSNHDHVEPLVYSLTGTPCENVLDRQPCLYPEGVWRLFPEDHLLEEMGIEGYYGVPMLAPDGQMLGLLAVLHNAPLQLPDFAQEVMALAAAQAGAELARQRAEQEVYESERRLETLMSHLPGMAYQCLNDAPYTPLFVSQGSRALTGYPPEAWIGPPARPLIEMVHPDDRPQVVETIDAAVELGQSFQLFYRLQHADGSLRWARERGQAVYDEEGKVRWLEGFVYDASDRYEVDRLAFWDSVTGLPNRRQFMERLQRACNEAQRHGTPLSLLYLDLQRFKEINDLHGHEVGDQLLAEVGQRFHARARDTELVARLGSDEFGVLLPGTDLGALPKALRRFQAATGEHIPIEGRHFDVITCAGGASLHHHAETAPQMLQFGGIALSHAKHNSSHRRIFDDEMSHALHRRDRLQERLTCALREDRLRVHFQPQVDLASGALTGAEALCRWHDDEWGWIPPAEFIPLAEERGLIQQLGNQVVTTTCHHLEEWEHRGLIFPGRVSINLSAHQLDFPQLCAQLTRLTGRVPAERLGFEITETALMRMPQQAVRITERLLAAGFSLAIDDFGVGYSSLNYLKRFAANTLKIDIAFVQDMLESSHDLAIVSTIIAMARTLGMKTVAEGVESREQARVLNELGCDQAQGHYFGHPVDADGFAEQWL